MRKVYIGKFDGEPSLRMVLMKALGWIEIEKIVFHGARVFIKPNFTYPFYKEGVTTSPIIIEELVKILLEYTPNITIGESDGGYNAWKAEEAFQGHNLYDIEKRYGVNLVNLSKSNTIKTDINLNSGKISIELPTLLLNDTDVFITVPVPKVHVMTKVSLGFKNQWGCIPDTMRLMYHHQFNELIVALNKLLNPKVALFDGTYFLDRTGPMEGDPIPMDLIVASNDLGAGSLVCCELMDIDAKKIKHHQYAHRAGMFTYSMDDVHLNDRIDNFKCRKFRLERRWIHWGALAVFHSKIGLKLVYDSPFSGIIRRLLTAIKGKQTY